MYVAVLALLFGLSTGQELGHNYRQLPLNCADEYTASWWEFPPYAVSNHCNSVLHNFVLDIVATCCKNRTHVRFRKRWKNMFDMTRSTSNDTFMFPYSLSVHDHQFRGPVPRHAFVPGPLSPGSFYVIKRARGSKILGVLWGAWPLLVIIMSASVLAGVVIWALDRNVNSVHFSRSFQTGFFEGVWWAFVTMTTVGYGDKTPTSFFGRVFGILWILFGICLMGTFMSVVTAALTSTKHHVDSITFKKVAVIAGTYDYVTALGNGATITLCDTRACLTNALNNESIDGILLDQYAAAFQTSTKNDGEEVNRRFITEDYDVAWKSNVPVNHGILVKGVEQNIQACFLEEAIRISPKTYERLRQLVDICARKDVNAATMAWSFLLNGDDVNFWVVTGGFCGVVVSICLILALVDHVVWRNKVTPSEMKDMADVK